ncbi:MAG: glycosyltransferase [Betaproteobacteria bacterium]|nr:glycosyltransferase [Betaproteobacteria bacterium]
MTTPSPQRCVSVVIPALNEARRIASVVQYAMSDPATAEVIVVDDSSVDETAPLAAAAGARVVTSSMLGKGASMEDGIRVARQPCVAFLDGDLAGLAPGIIGRMAAPILADTADFVKARFGRASGRVTELTAKPMLKVFFPELAHFAQPLGGLIAGRANLLRNLHCEDGYGVDVGLFIDAFLAGARLAEVDIGALEHESQTLADLTHMANEVGRVIFERARAAGRMHVDQVAAMYEMQRQAAADIDSILQRRRGRRGLLLLDMDGTVTPSRFAVELARATGQEAALAALLDGGADDAITRSERIAELFRFVPKASFERIAHALPIREGAIEFVNRMRRRGFMVGLVSDSYFIAAEIVRRRIFADFAVAHVINFSQGTCDGTLRINPAFQSASAPGAIDKANVLRRFLDDPAAPPIAQTWAVGDHTNDTGMLALADHAFLLRVPERAPPACPRATVIDSFAELIARVPDA